MAEQSPENTIIYGPNSDIAVYVSGVDSTAAIAGWSIRTHAGGYGCVILEAARQEAADLLGVGIWCDSSSIVIRGNKLFQNNAAVYLHRSPAKILENRVFSCLGGISCVDESNAVISRNDLSDCAALIEANDSLPLISQNVMWSDQDIVCDGFTGTNASATLSENRISGMKGSGIICGGGSPVIKDNLIDNCSTCGLQLNATAAAQVRGNLIVLQFTAIQVMGGTNAVIENNTIQQAGAGLVFDQTANPTAARNIVELCNVGINCYFPSNPIIACNDVFNCQDPYAGHCPDKTGIDGNFSQDPEYCGVDGSGNYFLQSDSPCAPGNHPDGHDCGLIGAHEVKCGEVDAQSKTWGNVKMLYK
jgi:hypothetical protein